MQSARALLIARGARVVLMRHARITSLARAAPAAISSARSIRRTLSSASSASSTLAAAAAASFVRGPMVNGILGQDDMYRRGLPPPKFVLPEQTPLSTFFASSRSVDPFALVANEIRGIGDSVAEVVGSDHPVLERIAQYFFQVQGKRVRPTLVLLMAQATSSLHASALAPTDVEAATRALGADAAARATPRELAAAAAGGSAILPSQRRLSQITEMIHTASLLHDDVIDDADTRRGVRSINAVFGNKLAILGGDFMLARASLALAQLRNPDAVMFMSISIEHLVKGEVMQLKGSDEKTLMQNVNFYLTKSFYKTASLMANSCRAAMALAGHAPDSVVADAAYEYGKYAGLAFQIVDDLLDLTASSDALGKPANHDLQQGLSTLPILYAAEEFPELHAMMARKFSHSDDVELALRLVMRSKAIERARALAYECAAHAVAAVSLNFPASPARSALISLVERVLVRDK